ncbi:MAG TPA: terpene cyclase/mutase family protein, partial [Chitinophagales bacterium]|nr:terpene cyclase/mutase family protein [Chitinophagales bacterium]
YGGPMFLLPGLVIASYVTETPFPLPHQILIRQYFLNHQNEDGGWGLHLEGKSTMFGTVLQYVALRLLGADKSAPSITKARSWILANGGATGIPSWGKFYLSILGVYEWEGNNSLFPEMWLFPEWLPFHPGRYWCHARMVYLPMAYCFGRKVVGKRTPLVEELRTELYKEDYASVNWSAARGSCAGADLYYPQSGALKAMNGALNVYEKFHLKGPRKKALDFCLEYINAEDDHTNYIDIGPVNQVINSICVYHAYGKESDQFKKHVDRWADYLWVAEDGMKMQGYNGSQLWDTAFATQAILEGGFEKYFPETVAKAFNFIDNSQVREEVRDHKKFFRHDSVGGWPFSTADHGWPITDCSAEGLKTVLKVEDCGLNLKLLDKDKRLKQSADLLLSMQNKSGGWASYELTRAPGWVELLNPSEIFGNIMIDYSYTECTSACVQALAEFRKHYPDYKKQEIEKSIGRGIRFILSQQRQDGSWYGSWAVCFTYGTWFAVEALASAETGIQNAELNTEVQKALDKAAVFLLSKQNADGGWGESFESCIEKRYIPAATSQVVNTSWAVLSLLELGKSAVNSRQSAINTGIQKGIQLIISRQQPTGDWEQESISGVFNHNCMISYTSYRNVFPIWALGRYLKNGCPKSAAF